MRELRNPRFQNFQDSLEPINTSQRSDDRPAGCNIPTDKELERLITHQKPPLSIKPTKKQDKISAGKAKLQGRNRKIKLLRRSRTYIICMYIHYYIHRYIISDRIRKGTLESKESKERAQGIELNGVDRFYIGILRII